ncbi:MULTISPECIES: phosphopantetheine-binding protein [Rheinheimera]|uniref:Phosphopantetheine-binding protein n=1 Tax=Rheinheimera maricola TaxID=2793282 RepID=A0ABS7XC81_9GAMM|nr:MULTISPECIES: phosphopantetheine-binding protein [Rheinheimera]MBZ9613151.1 phosphopantetheine-binding protein [Rheinheimera maricola]
MNFSRNEILDFVVNSIFLDRLELADDGYSAEDFSEETLILSEQGLGLDSVDVLDLLVGIEKKYQFKPIEIDSTFIDEVCASIGSVIDMVQSRMKIAA